jgi:hypothetical protein
MSFVDYSLPYTHATDLMSLLKYFKGCFCSFDRVAFLIDRESILLNKYNNNKKIE